MFKLYSRTQSWAAFSRSSPCSYGFYSYIFDFIFTSYWSSATLILIILSGITPSFSNDKAYILVLGNPSIIQLPPSFSSSAILFFTKEITIWSSTAQI
jgi:hypothetical protein